MSVITTVPEANIWDVICKEFAAERPPYKDDDDESIHTNYSDYDPAKHTPVFYQDGKMHKEMSGIDGLELEDFDPSKSHPSVYGHAFLDKPPPSPPKSPPPLPNPKTCSPRDYLESYIFPVLLPALDETLRQAKENKCFERKRTKFDALDFLTEYLYNHNKEKPDRGEVEFPEIPFVKEHWKLHPRPPLPMSLLWTEEEATLKIQAFWRGFKVRREPEIAELRVWQKDWRDENENIKKKVDALWAEKMPEGDKKPSKTKTPSPRRPVSGRPASAKRPLGERLTPVDNKTAAEKAAAEKPAPVEPPPPAEKPKPAEKNKPAEKEKLKSADKRKLPKTPSSAKNGKAE